MLVMPVLSNIEHAFLWLVGDLVHQEHTLFLFYEDWVHGTLRLHVVSRFYLASKRPQIFRAPVKWMRLLVHPEGGHHRCVYLLLRRLLLINWTLSVGVLRSHSEPPCSLGEHSHDAILASELRWCRVIIYTNGYNSELLTFVFQES